MGKYFDKCKTLNELKKLYKELARENHPDFGGNVETMQKINAEYDDMIKYFAKYGSKTEKAKAEKEVPEKFRKIIETLLKMPYIQVEIIGCWIWLSGNVALYLRKIQQMGFKFSTKQKRYYLADGISAGVRASRWSMERIREEYGSEILESTEQIKFIG